MAEWKSLPEAIPLEALFAADGISLNPAVDPRTLHMADVIFSTDIMSGEKALIYGRDALEQVSRSGRAKRLAILNIAIDQQTEDLEKLVALVRAIKGRDDYESSS